MNICTCHTGKFNYDDLGIFVELTAGADAQFHYKIERIGMYRIKLIISLPPERSGVWALGICQILRKVQAGAVFPVRFEQENALQYLTMDTLRLISNSMPKVTTYVYAKKEKEVPTAMDEAWRKVRNAINRQNYAEKGRQDRRGYLVQVDGQMSLF